MIYLINKVERCLAALLISIKVHPDFSGVTLIGNEIWEDIPIIGLASATVADTVEKKQNIYTTTLSFQSTNDFPISTKAYCFRLTTADGRQLLMGTSNRPYVIRTTNSAYPSKPSDASGKTYTFTYKNIHELLAIAK